MYYVLILKNKNTGRLNIEYTNLNPEERLMLHNLEEIEKTRNFLPLEIVYYEAFKSKKDAISRKNSLKLYGNAWAQLKRRIERSLK